MTAAPDPGRDDEAFWRDFLTRGDSMERKVRGIFKLIPQGPRCKPCAAPFAGVGAPLMRMIGKRPSDTEHRSLELKGKELPTEVVVVHADTARTGTG